MCSRKPTWDSVAAGNYQDVWLDGEHESDFDEGDEDEDVA